MHRNGRTFPKILIILRECCVFVFFSVILLVLLLFFHVLALFTHSIINNQMKRDNDIPTADVFSFFLFHIVDYVSCCVYCIFLDFIITFFSSSLFTFAHTGACAYLIIAIIKQNATLLTRVHCSFCCFIYFPFLLLVSIPPLWTCCSRTLSM